MNPATITTYAELQSALTEYLLNSDVDTTDIPLFISMAETLFNEELTLRNLMGALQSGVLAGGSTTLALPADFIETELLRFNTSPVSVPDQVAPRVFSALVAREQSGVPIAYTMLDGQFEFAPVSPTDIPYEHYYVAKVTPLSDAAPTNALLSASPLLYLSASLMQAFLFFEDNDAASKWEMVYARVKKGLASQDMRQRWSRHSRMQRGDPTRRTRVGWGN